MKRIKNFTLGVFGATILSLGLYACSNDDAVTTPNSSTEQITMVGKSTMNFDEMEEMRFILATGMAEFVEALKPVYHEVKSYEEFQDKLGVDVVTLPIEGENLLKASYNILKEGQEKEVIKATYSGIEFGTALLFQEEAMKLNPNLEGKELFGANSSLTVITNSASGCKWWQLGCWVDTIWEPGTFKEVIDNAFDKVGIFLCKALGGQKCD